VTFSELIIKRMTALIETANKDSAWEMEAVTEMMKATHLLRTLSAAQSKRDCGDFYLVPRGIIDQFPEINNNYDHDDACALNAWGCEVVTNANPAPAQAAPECCKGLAPVSECKCEQERQAQGHRPYLRDAQASRETGWLVEWPEDDNVSTRWWNPNTGWMRDANKAMRFCRECDAADYINGSGHSTANVKPTEHVFLSSVSSTHSQCALTGGACQYCTEPVQQVQDDK
jgi:hypothetical protein